MKKFFLLLLIIIPVVLLVNCPSGPEVTPEVTPEPTSEAVEETPTPAPEATPAPGTFGGAVTDQEILEVRNAIARAEEVNAAEYAAEELADAKTSLSSALDIQESDPQGARDLLGEAKTSADAAYEIAVKETAASYVRKLRLTDSKLLEIEADKFLPLEYGPLADDHATVINLNNEGQYVEALTLGRDTLGAMNVLHESLSEKLRQIESLKDDTDKNLKTAEKYEAYLYTPDKLNQINEYYFLGIAALEEYKIDNAEEYLGYAKELSIDMLASAAKAKKAKEAEDLKNEVLNLLEESSKLNVVTEDGEVIEADPINMEEFLKSIEEELDAEEAEGEPQALLNWVPGRVRVLADVESDSLLNQAKELIKLGIIAERNGELDAAMEYYIQARNYLRLHKAQSVSKIYTVRLIPERRDCLWRIAEYEDIYGDPYLWPLIWRRNRKMIQNPNLIEPGWQLIIPEQ